MYNGVILQIGFFRDKDDTFIARVVPVLQPLYVKQKEFVYKKNDYAMASKWESKSS